MGVAAADVGGVVEAGPKDLIANAPARAAVTRPSTAAPIHTTRGTELMARGDEETT
jgi:hypothetical protein